MFNHAMQTYAEQTDRGRSHKNTSSRDLDSLHIHRDARGTQLTVSDLPSLTAKPGTIRAKATPAANRAVAVASPVDLHVTAMAIVKRPSHNSSVYFYNF